MAQRHEELENYQQHNHEALVHHHEHYHVTHNFNARTGAFDHLNSEHDHDHDHDHASVSHGHYPHRDFEEEHSGEAHDHDHGEPVKQRSPRRVPAKKATSPKKSEA